MLMDDDKRLREEVNVNRIAIKETWRFYNGDTVIKTCRGIISHFLLSNGLSFTWGRQNKKLTSAFQSLIEAHWIPFCQEAMDVIMVMGLLPVTIGKTSLGDPIPIVLKPGTYDITVYCDGDKKKYRVWRHNEYGLIADKPAYFPDPTVHVFDHFGCSPTLDGELTTAISCLMPKAYFEAGLYECATTAEILSSNPALVTEARESEAARQGLQWDIYADGDQTEAQEDDKFRRGRRDIALLERQKELYEAYMIARRGGRVDSEKAKAWDNEYPLPADRRIVHQMQARARTDLVNLTKSIQDEKCAAMGVPRSIIANDGGVVRGNLEGQTENFHQTLLHWRDDLSRVLTKIYHATYGKGDARAIVNELTGSKGTPDANGEISVKRRAPLITEKDLYTAHEENFVTVSFPIRTAISHEKLIMMWSMGFIGWDTLSQEVLRSAQFPIGALDQEKDPWSKEERKAFVLQVVKKVTALAGNGGTGGGGGKAGADGKTGGQEKKKKKKPEGGGGGDKGKKEKKKAKTQDD